MFTHEVNYRPSSATLLEKDGCRRVLDPTKRIELYSCNPLQDRPFLWIYVYSRNNEIDQTGKSREPAKFVFVLFNNDDKLDHIAVCIVDGNKVYSSQSLLFI